MMQGLDEQQSVQILQCYLQEDYRGTRNSLKVCVPTWIHSTLVLIFMYGVEISQVTIPKLYYITVKYQANNRK